MAAADDMAGRRGATPRTRALWLALLVGIVASGGWWAHELRREATYPARAVVSSASTATGPLLAGFYGERRGIFADCSNVGQGVGAGVRANEAPLSSAGLR